ncbi:hypothetical protein Tco_1035175 [Tanacetum coccineum]
MADENVPAPTPTRFDEHILLFAAWVPIGKSNYVLDLQKKQKNLIFQIFMDILQNTNFFRAFTASASLDETRFVLDVNLLREALEITPIDQAYQFVSPPPDKTSGHDRPRYPVLQMLWGIITSTNVDYAELMWEEFVQAMQTFLTDKANLGSPTKKGRKDKPHIIPYCRFTKLIICHLERIHNIHQRSASLFHLAEEDLRLGSLKFVSKGEIDEVFGMPIPNELISNNIKNAPYYNAYLEMVAKHDQKVAAKKEGKKKSASTKQPKPKPAIEKSSKPAPAPKLKVTTEKPSKASTAKPPKPKLAKEKSTKAIPLQKVGRVKLQKHKHVGGVAIREPVAEATRPLPVVESKEASTRPSTQPLDDTSANIVHHSPSSTDAETCARSDKTNSGGDIGSFITWFCKRIRKKKLIDLVNPKGHWLIPNVKKPLHLGGPPGQVTIQSQFFFNKDVEYLVSGDKGRRSALSISKLKAAQYLDFGLEELVPSLWIESESKSDITCGFSVLSVLRLMKDTGIPQISEADFTRNTRSLRLTLRMCTRMTLKIYTYFIFKDAFDFLFKKDYTIVSKPRAVIYRDKKDQKKTMGETEGMETIIWSEDDRRRSKDFMEVIERRLKIRRIFRSLESFVGGRLRDVDYRLIQRTE